MKHKITKFENGDCRRIRRNRRL